MLQSSGSEMSQNMGRQNARLLLRCIGRIEKPESESHETNLVVKLVIYELQWCSLEAASCFGEEVEASLRRSRR